MARKFSEGANWQQQVHEKWQGNSWTLSGTRPLPPAAIEPEALASIAAAQAPALSDDLYKVIRAIVPPPPVDFFTNHSTCKTPEIFSHLSCENLFTRRQSESSEEKFISGSSSLDNCRINLEKLLSQITEPKILTEEDDIMHEISSSMLAWPNDEEVQVKALACLVQLHKNSHNFSKPEKLVLLILRTMKDFQRNEMIQRRCVKLLTSDQLSCKVRRKVDVACLLLNSLCCLSGVDDFMIYLEQIVRDLDASDRMLIRTCKQYVEMLLNFPNRLSDIITVRLCWSALDILLLLAECDGKWLELVSTNGKTKLQLLSSRPELEDRCKVLLRKVFFDGSPIVPVSALAPQDTRSSKFHRSFIRETVERTVLINSVASAHTHKGQLLSTGIHAESRKLREDTVSGRFKGVTTGVPSVDEFVTRAPLTPPPTLADIDDDLNTQFSDDSFHEESSSLAQFSSSSPSYSPPIETSLSLLEENLLFEGPPFPCPSRDDPAVLAVKVNPEIVSCKSSFKPIENEGGRGLCQVSSPNLSHPSLPPKINGFKSPSVFCFICKEPKGKQPLLVTQLRQISHCLLQPCNLILLNCLKSNLCQHHSL